MQIKQKPWYGHDRVREEADISDKKKHRLKPVKTFKCSMISENGGCDEKVRHRITAGWVMRRETSGIVCDKKMPIMLKRAVYNTVHIPVTIYG